MCIYKNILDSYRTGEGWNVPFLSPQQMAFVGLRYTGVDAIVICDYCNVVFKHWVRGVDPYIRHKMASPNCTSYENKSGVYHAVSLEWSNSLQKLQRQFIHTEFASFESRLSTFEKCKRQLYQDPRSLCEAGFFYTGNGKNDEFMCFCCSVRLIDWKRTDDPWVEHARVFPTCSYLLLTKSKSFVVTVHQLIQKYSNLDCFNETLIDSLSSNPDQAFKMTLRKRRPINVTTTVQKRRKNSTEPEDDTRLCIICLQAESTIIIYPCGHFYSCVSCALSVNKCGICRGKFKRVIKACTVNIKKTALSLPGTSSESLNISSKSNICKICYKQEINILFIPCRHVGSCCTCAHKMKKCNICDLNIIAKMQVFLN